MVLLPKTLFSYVCKQIVSIINRLISDTDFRHLAQRQTSAFNENVVRMITAILFGTVLVILQNLLCSAFVSLSILRRKSSENVCGFFASCKMASESSLETASRSALLKLFSAIIAFSPK